MKLLEPKTAVEPIGDFLLIERTPRALASNLALPPGSRKPDEDDIVVKVLAVPQLPDGSEPFRFKPNDSVVVVPKGAVHVPQAGEFAYLLHKDFVLAVLR